MAKTANLTSIQLRQLISYNPETGLMTWRSRPQNLFKTRKRMLAWNTRHAGTECFTSLDPKGYRHGAIFGMRASAHRVAWCIHHGFWPPELVDHINGEPADNRIANLRLASLSENSRNGKIRSNMTSGFAGVQKRSAKSWRAVAYFEGRRYTVGSFGCAVRAALERDKRMREFHCPFTVFNFPLPGETAYRRDSPHSGVSSG